MERGDPVIQRLLRAGPLLFALLLSAATHAYAADHLVLCVSANSKVTALNSIELQKLFLGLSVIVDGEKLHPLRNESDPQIRQIFYQNIVSMSESIYDSRVLASTLQQGRIAPASYANRRALFEALANDPNGVSYAWADDVAHDPRLKALRVLWHE
jgi:hypothetical protein